MSPMAGSDRDHLGEPLITVDPKNLHARTRIPSVFAMATHSTLAKYLDKEKSIINNQGVKFNMASLASVMDCWQFEYEALAPSLDGGARKEYVDVSKLAAIGSADESGALASSVLNEGAKNLKEKK